MPDLTRDALIEDVRDEISGWNIGSGYYQTTIGVDEASELAPVAVNAVLRFIADDLDGAADDADCDCQTDSDVTTCDCIRHLTAGGIRDAADHIRSLLPPTEGDQP